jgi:hypothetical protein
VSPMKYELGFCIAEDSIRHSHSRENLKSYIECVSLKHAGIPHIIMTTIPLLDERKNCSLQWRS